MACTKKLELFSLSGAGYALEAQAPCTVLQALEGAGVLSGLETGLGAREAEWAAAREWTFCTQADVSDWADERCYLRFARLRGAGVVRVNGREAASFADGPLVLDVTGDAFGADTLRVEVAFRPAAPVGSPARAVQGIAGRVSLCGVSALCVEHFSLRAEMERLSADVTVTPFVPGRYTFRYAVTQGEEALGLYEIEESLPAARTALLHTLEPQENPWPVWRPGRPNAPVTVRLQVLRRGMGCDAARVHTGFRSLETALALPGQPAALCGVNGKPVQIYAARHEPDAHHAHARGHYDALVRLAQEARLNALYVCGEEDEAFYDACDEAGMMVWQRLPQSGAYDAAARLCHHPCVVQWAATDLPEAQAAMGRLSDGRPVTPPERRGLPGAGAEALVMCGPEHAPGMEDMACRFAQDTAAVRVVPVRAYADACRLAALAGDQAFWPETGPLWALREPGEAAVDREMLRDACGEVPAEDARALCGLSRFLQAETLRQAALAARMRAASVVLGSLREDFARLCSDALVEADGLKRPAFFAVREALAPLCLAIRLDRTAYWPGTHLDGFIHLLCAEEMRDLTVRATLYSPAGETLWEEARVVARRTQEVLRAYAELPEAPGVLLLRVQALEGATVAATAEQLVCVGAPGPMWPLLHPSPAALRVRDGRVKNEGAFTALGVLTDRGYLNLLPGEEAPCGTDAPECLNG